jgi:hypothetical protein
MMIVAGFGQREPRIADDNRDFRRAVAQISEQPFIAGDLFDQRIDLIEGISLTCAAVTSQRTGAQSDYTDAPIAAQLGETP